MWRGTSSPFFPNRPLSIASTQRHQRGVNSLISSYLNQLYLALLGTTRYYVNRMSYHRV